MKNLFLIFTVFPYFYGFGSAYQFAIGPLLYLYVKSLVDRKFRFKAKDLLHFIPFFFFHFQEFPEFFSSAFNGASSLFVFDPVVESPLHRFIVWELQPLIYASLLVRLLQIHADEIKQLYAKSDRVSFKWLRNVFYIYGGVWLVKSIAEPFLPMSIYMDKLYYIPLSIFLTSFHIYIIAYLGLNRSSVPPPRSVPLTRYKGSQLTTKKSKEYLQLLIENMENEKTFTDPKLTLPTLSSRLSINSRYLSQVINENLGQNFYDFVNSYRIEEAKRRLADPDKDKYTIEAIASDVGFNSKAAFYSTFKKQTNMTPSEFRALNKLENGKGHSKIPHNRLNA